MDIQHSSPIKKWNPLIVLSLALAIIVIDTTLLNVSLGTIIHELNTDIQSIQWVITAYTLMLAAFTITGGRFGDLFGRKRMFVLGAIIFAVGSFVASISTNVVTMIAGESIIEGIGAALMLPATTSLLVANYKGRDRAIAFGIWGGIAAASSAIGPILGGWLTSHYSWRWGFRINVVVVALLLIGSFLVDDSRDEEEKPTIDTGGIIFSALGLFLIVFGVIKAADYGWWWAKESFTLLGQTFPAGALSLTPLFILLGTLVLTLFILWEQLMARRNKTPLVSLKLFQNKQFTSGALTTGILSLGQAGMLFSIPVFLQAVRKLDAFNTGLAMLPLSMSLLVAAPFAAFMSKYIPPKRLVQAGMVMNIIGFWLLRSSLTVDARPSNLIAGFVCYGIGMGMVFSQISNITLSAVSVQEAGEASGVNNTLRQVGATLGSAIIGAVLLSTLASNLVADINQSSVIPTSLKATVSETITKETSSVEFGQGAVIPNIAPAVEREVLAVTQQATTDANKNALTYGTFFAVLGFLVSFLLPSSKNIEVNQSVATH